VILEKNTKKLLLFTVGILFLCLPLISIYAQSADELKGKIDQSNAEIAKLEQEIANYQKQLTAVGAQANTLSNAIKKLDLTRQKLLTDIKVTEKKINSATIKIEQLGLQINDKKSTIEDNRSALNESMRALYELDRGTIVETILSNKSFSDAWQDIDNIGLFQGKIKEKVNQLAETKKGLENNRSDAEDARQELFDLKGELSDQKKIVEQNTAEEKSLLKKTKNQEANYKKIVADKIALKNAFEQEIRDYESKLKFILDPNTLPGRVLSWPLDKVFLTQQFGSTVDSKRLYVSGTHNGVDFRAAVGTPVKAMASGTVIGTGDTDITCPGASFGRWVLIRYNNGLSSTYGHLSLIKANNGDVVSVGTIVGYSGNTGYSTGPHLHVSMYASNAVQVQSLPSKSCSGRIYTMPIAATNGYLDPLAFLPKI
jgi:murein DD-endopeptidase MepM/ murein hydrolase activator NlpD